jgi:hypothetical protein
MNIQNCYKILIESLCDWTNWTGKYAQMLDDCSASDSEDVNLYSLSPTAVASDIERYVWGDGTIAGTYCWSSPIVLAFVMPTLMEYFGDNNVIASG